MSNLLDFYNYDSSRKLLLALIDSPKLEIRFSEDKFVSDFDKELALKKIKYFVSESAPNLPLLLRGITKSILKSKLIEKLNSNDSLYDGLFLVGDKAKNFIYKSNEMPHH